MIRITVVPDFTDQVKKADANILCILCQNIHEEFIFYFQIECLFYVLTCVGRDIETHLPKQLDALLSLIRDAFLNSSASTPTIRRTLLQLIELQASEWQLPGNTVLYYYPTK